jgi:N-acetylornithine carbamoyltransferase
MDDVQVPRKGRFVLSWAWHPRALPLAVPATALHMAAMRGMDVTVLRPEGFALPRTHHGQGAPRRGASGGTVHETADRARRSKEPTSSTPRNGAPRAVLR